MNSKSFNKKVILTNCEHCKKHECNNFYQKTIEIYFIPAPVAGH